MHRPRRVVSHRRRRVRGRRGVVLSSSTAPRSSSSTKGSRWHRPSWRLSARRTPAILDAAVDPQGRRGGGRGAPGLRGAEAGRGLARDRRRRASWRWVAERRRAAQAHPASSSSSTRFPSRRQARSCAACCLIGSARGSPRRRAEVPAAPRVGVLVTALAAALLLPPSRRARGGPDGHVAGHPRGGRAGARVHGNLQRQRLLRLHLRDQRGLVRIVELPGPRPDPASCRRAAA